MSPKKKNLLLGCTGSVATVKVPELVCTLSKTYNIKIVVSEAAKEFLRVSLSYNPSEFHHFRSLLSEKSQVKLEGILGHTESEVIESLRAGDEEEIIEQEVQMFTDKDEWLGYNSVKKDPVLHIELRKWADGFIICPLTANTLAKISCGICDNLLTCVFRAWDFSTGEKKIFLCPAMNTVMYQSPLTKNQLIALRNYTGEAIKIISPIEKTLACGDTGDGALASVKEIVRLVNVEFQIG